MDYSIPRYRFHLQRAAMAPADTLTAKEQAIKEALQSLQGNTLWHHVIQMALSKENIHEFKKLVTEIYSQSRDNRSIMEGIIGKELMKAIEAWMVEG